MHIGLIGGIGPAATDFYYRRLISLFADNQVPLELTIVHADTRTLLSNLAGKKADEQVEIYMKLTDRLVSAGAQCVVVTSIAGHFCIEPFQALSPLPVIDMIAEIGSVITRRDLKRIGILGTRTVMETRLYGSIANAEVLPPRGKALADVHEAYVELAATGILTEAQRDVFHAAIKVMLGEDKAEAIMLGGTDLTTAFNERESAFPLIDCAGIHVDAVARIALSK
jgi:aspartate racemase